MAIRAPCISRQNEPFVECCRSGERERAATFRYPRLTGHNRGVSPPNFRFAALTLLVTDEPGILTGAILFYFQQRTTEKDPWTSVPGLPEAIFHPQFDGKTLLFEVSHRRAHPPRTLSDPPKHFRLTLLEPDKAELVNVDEPGMTCKVIRSDH